MKKEFVLPVEDLEIADMVDFCPFNRKMLPYFVFYYRKLHSKLEQDDLLESLEELFEDADGKVINSETSFEDRLYNGYKDYPRIYCLFLCWAMDYISDKIRDVCYDIRMCIYDDDGDGLASDILDALEEESKIKPLIRKIELEPRDAFLERPFLRSTNIYTESFLGKLVNKLWKTTWKEDVEKLLINVIQTIGSEYVADEEWPLYLRKIHEQKSQYSLDDVIKHISDADIRNEVEQFINEHKSAKPEKNTENKIHYIDIFDILKVTGNKTDENDDNISDISKENKTNENDDNISDDEFIDNVLNKDYDDVLPPKDDERIESLFIKREDLVERILTLSDVKQQIYLLASIGTGRSQRFAWDIVVNKAEVKYYQFILDIYGERFQLKYLRKEIIKRNKYCVTGILESNNKRAVKFLFAILWNGIVLSNDISLLELKDAVNDEIIHLVSDHGYMSHLRISRSFSPMYLYKLYISSIFHSKENGEIETSDNLWNIPYDHSNSCECLFDIIYEMLSKNNVLSNNLKKFIGYSFYHNTLKNHYDHAFDAGHMNDYSNAYFIYSVLTSWSENKDIKPEDIDKYESEITGKYELCYFFQIAARIILNAKFTIPEYSEKNEKMVRQLLYPKTRFLEFLGKMAIEKDLPSPEVLDKKKAWKEFWRNIIIGEQLKIYNKFPIKQSYISLPIEPEYEEYILSRSDDIFASALDTLMVHEFKEFLFQQRKKNIEALKKGKFFNETDAEKLLALVKETADYYGLSDKDIESCLSEEKSEKWWEEIHTRLEAEIMCHIFEKCLLWVVKFDKSELWESAPWWGMKIFSNSFADRPMVWAKHLFRALNSELEETELLHVCFALGDLREPLGGMVPQELKRVADKQNSQTRERILRQYRRFNRGNIKKGKHTGNEKKRVDKCRKKLLAISENRFGAPPTKIDMDTTEGAR
jgi:hypothetical protein